MFIMIKDFILNTRFIASVEIGKILTIHLSDEAGFNDNCFTVTDTLEMGRIIHTLTKEK